MEFFMRLATKVMLHELNNVPVENDVTSPEKFLISPTNVVTSPEEVPISPKNVVTSPISLNVVVNMLAAGTKGRTMEQLLGALQSDNIEELNRTSSQMMSLFEPLNNSDQGGPVDRASSQMMPLFEPLNSGPENRAPSQMMSLFKPLNSGEGGMSLFGPFNRGEGGRVNRPSSQMMSMFKPLNRGEGGPVLSITNGLWVDRKYPLQTSYKETAETVYKACAETVNFENQAGREEVRQRVNKWTETATKGLIKRMLGPFDIDQDSILVFGSVLYFKGAWEDAFEKRKTRDEDFHLLSGETIKVPFMVRNHRLHFFGSFDGFKLLKLPYRCGYGDSKKFSMYVFLPQERNGLEGLLQKFNSNPLTLYRHCDMLKEVQLSEMLLPKFKFSYKSQPANIMKEMWVDLPFKKTGDFKDMVNTPYIDKVYVQNIIQQSCIEVNEEGTEAAAVTFSSMGMSFGCAPPPSVSFVADHPFVFMIREDVSGTVFFTGFVFNPLLNN